MEIYPQNATVKLGFDEIRNLVADKCLGEKAKQLALQTLPSADLATIRLLLTITKELMDLIRSEVNYPKPSYPEFIHGFKSIQLPGFAEQVDQLYQFYLLIRVFTGLHIILSEQADNWPLLSKLTRDIDDISYILADFKQVFDEEGEIKDSASETLLEIRKEIRAGESGIEKTFNRLLKSCKQKELLSEETESIRSGERVLAVKNKFKRSIKGIILGESGSGKTFFILPQEILNLRNSLFELRHLENKEIYHIRTTLTSMLCPHYQTLTRMEAFLVQFEFTTAKARVALDNNWQIPVFNTHDKVELIQACHPGLQLKNKSGGKITVPFNLALNKETRILVVSGPNAGGKSVILKAMGLIQMMAQSGLAVPADPSSQLCCYRKLFVDIGDDQDISEDLSTYSSHLKKFKYFIKNANPDTLFLIDELGSGTDPQAGGDIAEVILDELRQKGSRGVVTTHYSNLKIYAHQHPELINAAMDFDPVELKPTFNLITGRYGSSYAFELLKNAGYSKSFLGKIKKAIGDKTADVAYLYEELIKEKRSLELRLISIDTKEKEIDTLVDQNNEFRKKQKEISRQSREQSRRKADDYLNNINKRFEKLLFEISKSGKQKQDDAKRKFKEALEQEKQNIEAVIHTKKERSTNRKELHIHDMVGVEGIENLGEVVEIKGKKLTVVINGIRTKVTEDKVLSIEKTPARVKKSKVSYFLAESTKDFYPVIDIRGLRKDEAEKKMEEFVDAALINKSHLLRVVHGLGDGVLKVVVAGVLRQYNFVKNIRFENEDKGGEGVTIFEMD